MKEKMLSRLAKNRRKNLTRQCVEDAIVKRTIARKITASATMEAKCATQSSAIAQNVTITKGRRPCLRNNLLKSQKLTALQFRRSDKSL